MALNRLLDGRKRMMRYENRIVTDRVLLLGLDELYRARMKWHESGELLTCASDVARVLGVSPASVPVEGYYTESPELESYFLLMRALQFVGKGRQSGVSDLPSYHRLLELTSSPIFGVPVDEGRLLPAARDPLTGALEQVRMTEWSVGSLMSMAAKIADGSDDCSLVGLATLSGDAVVVTALRETVVLYAFAPGSALRPPKPRYVWEVSDELARRAGVFVERFNALFDDSLPMPHPENAAVFWRAHRGGSVSGRCVRIGFDDRSQPYKHYHWAIRIARSDPTAEHEVQEFWDTTLWTTEAYRTDPNSPRLRRQ